MAERSHFYGIIICAITIMTAIFFLGALYVIFWIGRALIATPIEPPADD